MTMVGGVARFSIGVTGPGRSCFSEGGDKRQDEEEDQPNESYAYSA